MGARERDGDQRLVALRAARGPLAAQGQHRSRADGAEKAPPVEPLLVGHGDGERIVDHQSGSGSATVTVLVITPPERMVAFTAPPAPCE